MPFHSFWYRDDFVMVVAGMNTGRSRTISRRCHVPDCSSVYLRDRLPDDPQRIGCSPIPFEPRRRSIWFKNLGCIPTRKNVFVCHRHFKEEHIKKTGADGCPLLNFCLTKDAVPTENLPRGRQVKSPIYQSIFESAESQLRKLRSSGECE